MSSERTIYDELGVRQVINGVGTRTQVSGARMRDGVTEAMARAAEAHVYVPDLQARASELIAEATGAEAGFVTPGAAAGMLLGTAACIAGDDYGTMAGLPDTDGIASDVLIPKAHRFKYDVGLRASGATLVDVGHVSHHPIDGGADRVEPWEIAAAVDEETVAVAYVERPHNVLELETVVDVAHDHDLPVIVDAASEVPPRANLERFIERGADLVAFSGGKGIRGPQPSGFVAGRPDLVRSVALQQLPDGYDGDLWDPPATLIDRGTLPRGTPSEGIGRPLKVGPEEIVGLLTALEGFIEEDHETTLVEWRERAELIADELDGCPHLDVRLSDGHDKASGVPKVIGRVREDAPLSTVELIGRLRREDPRVWVGERRVHLDEFTVSPQELTDDEASYLAERVLARFE
jgi:L-seryl-tRNA(Ser) seleniumtransferase